MFASTKGEIITIKIQGDQFKKDCKPKNKELNKKKLTKEL